MRIGGGRTCGRTIHNCTPCTESVPDRGACDACAFGVDLRVTRKFFPVEHTSLARFRSPNIAEGKPGDEATARYLRRIVVTLQIENFLGLALTCLSGRCPHCF